MVSGAERAWIQEPDQCLISALGKKMLRKEPGETEMMLETKKTVLEIHGAEIKSTDGDFSMKT